MEPWLSRHAGQMTPDERAGADDPTKPLPIDPDITADPSAEPGVTEPMVAPHVPVASVSTEPLDPVPAGGAPATTAGARPDRSRAVTGALIAATALLGIAVIVFLTLYLQNNSPAPALTPSPSSTPTLTTPPTEGPPVDVPETPEDAPDEPDEPAPDPTTPPDPTDPPDPDPTETPAGG